MVDIYFDTEFTELTKNAKLLSIGLISQDGKEFYEELNYLESEINPWVRKNVIPRLKKEKKISMVELKKKLEDWFKPFTDPILMIGDVLQYDWVLFCDIFGGSLSIPPNISYAPLDISTVMIQRRIDPDINRLEFLKKHGITMDYQHNALMDAKICKRITEDVLRIWD